MKGLVSLTNDFCPANFEKIIIQRASKCFNDYKTSINVFVNHEEPIETPPYFIFIFILSISSFDFVSLLVLLI